MSEKQELMRLPGMNDTKLLVLAQKVTNLLNSPENWEALDANGNETLPIKARRKLAEALTQRGCISSRVEVYALLTCRAVQAITLRNAIWAEDQEYDAFFEDISADADQALCLAAASEPSLDEMSLPASEKVLLGLGCVWDVLEP